MTFEDADIAKLLSNLDQAGIPTEYDVEYAGERQHFKLDGFQPLIHDYQYMAMYTSNLGNTVSQRVLAQLQKQQVGSE